jgi:pimeloyl-ACP methyl ester carboxylesterase
VLCLLGPSELRSQDGVRPLELRPKGLALLAYLAVVGEPQARPGLADLLFPEAANPRDSLRWYLSYLRRQLPDVLRSDRVRVSAHIATDVAAFRSGAARILDGCSLAEAAQALALYRGDLCEGLALDASADFDNWLYVQEDELRRLFRRATQRFARQALTQGHGAMAAPSLLRLTAIDPYFEEGHVLLVEATEASGNAVGARHVYDRYQRIVRSELHAEPRHELAARYEPKQPTGRELPLDELVPLREITMHVVEWPGQDPAILYVHGSGMHALRFTAWGELLSPEVRTVAVDLRGHGYSDKPPSGYGVDDHVSDLLELIAALGLDRPIMFGHSLGGSIATFVAEAAGDTVGGLVLLDAVVGDQAFIESASVVLQPIAATLDHRFGFEEYQSLWAEEDDGSQWMRWIARSARMDLAPLPDGTFRRRALRQALADEWASVAERDALSALSRVSAPVLVVHADAPWTVEVNANTRSPATPYIDHATVNAQLAAAHDARLYVSRGQHHSDLILRPNTGAIDAVREFAKELRRRGATARSRRRAARTRPREVSLPRGMRSPGFQFGGLSRMSLSQVPSSAWSLNTANTPLLPGAGRRGELTVGNAVGPVGSTRRLTTRCRNRLTASCPSAQDRSRSFQAGQLRGCLLARGRFRSRSKAGVSRLAALRVAGADPSHRGDAGKRRGATQSRQQRERREWEAANPRASSDPESFTREILPGIQGVPLSELATATGLSLLYVSQIRRGVRVPHRRHWAALVAASTVHPASSSAPASSLGSTDPNASTRGIRGRHRAEQRPLGGSRRITARRRRQRRVEASAFPDPKTRTQVRKLCLDAVQGREDFI